MLNAPLRLQWGLEGRIANLSQLGFVDDAFRLADRYSAAAMTRVDSPAFLFDPGMAAARRDPRFMAFAARLGLVDYWRSTGKWPDFCSDPALHYDCKAEAARLASAGSRRGG
jgi:hypothetical protein